MHPRSLGCAGPRCEARLAPARMKLAVASRTRCCTPSSASSHADSASSRASSAASRSALASSSASSTTSRASHSAFHTPRPHRPPGIRQHIEGQLAFEEAQQRHWRKVLETFEGVESAPRATPRISE